MVAHGSNAAGVGVITQRRASLDRRRLITQETPLPTRVANDGQETVVQDQRRAVEQSTRLHAAAKKRHLESTSVPCSSIEIDS